MFDVRKMERPHRSGVVAVCVAYALLYVAADLSAFDVTGDGTIRDTIICHLTPFFCIGHHRQYEQQEVKQYSVTKLVYCPTCKVRERKEEGKCRLAEHLVDERHNYSLWVCKTADDCSERLKDAGELSWCAFPEGVVLPHEMITGFKSEGR